MSLLTAGGQQVGKSLCVSAQAGAGAGGRSRASLWESQAALLSPWAAFCSLCTKGRPNVFPPLGCQEDWGDACVLCA